MSEFKITVDRDGWTTGLQLAAWAGERGLRLAGPKYNGSSTEVASFTLAASDLRDLRELIDSALGEVSGD